MPATSRRKAGPRDAALVTVADIQKEVYRSQRRQAILYMAGGVVLVIFGIYSMATGDLFTGLLAFFAGALGVGIALVWLRRVRPHSRRRF